MKAAKNAGLLLLAALILTIPVRADIISPAKMVGGMVLEALPYLLVAAVVVVTAVLLRNFRKKK